jgi:hypothetical protein
VQVAGSPVSTMANQFKTLTFTILTSAISTDGILDIGFKNGGADPYFVVDGIDISTPQLVDQPAPAGSSAPSITDADLAPIVQAAIGRWSLAGISAAQVSQLQHVNVHVSDIADPTTLGMSLTNEVVIDSNAAGYGWFVDAAPNSNVAFSQQVSSTELKAAPSSPAFGKIDLLTVVMHELGHELGLPDLDSAADATSLMALDIGTGIRRLPTPELVAQTTPAATASQTQALDQLFAQSDVDLSVAGAAAESHAVTSPALVQQLSSFSPVQIAGSSVPSATSTALPPVTQRVVRSSGGNSKFSNQVDAIFGSLGDLGR